MAADEPRMHRLEDHLQQGSPAAGISLTSPLKPADAQVEAQASSSPLSTGDQQLGTARPGAACWLACWGGCTGGQLSVQVRERERQ
jgi:hypothetical protein